MRRLPALIVFWFAVAATVAIAEPPRPQIVGPTGGLPGDILLLDATQSIDCDHFDWSVTPRLPEGRPTILPIEGGHKAIVTSVPGTYTIFLAGGNDEGVKLIEWSVTVGSGPGPAPGPTPPPGPEPGPEPTPPTPEPERFGLRTLAPQWAAAVTGGTRATEAAALSAAFEAAAAQVVATSPPSPDKVIAILAAHCSPAVPAARRPAWSGFDEAFGAAINELYKSGQLKTNDDWAAAFREVAAGLATVR